MFYICLESVNLNGGFWSFKTMPPFSFNQYSLAFLVLASCSTKILAFKSQSRYTWVTMMSLKRRRKLWINSAPLRFLFGFSSLPPRLLLGSKATSSRQGSAERTSGDLSGTKVSRVYDRLYSDLIINPPPAKASLKGTV